MRKWKGILSATLAVAMVLTLIAVAPVSAQAKAKKPTLAKSKVTLTVGKSSTIKIKNRPKGTTVSYSSSKKSVATVTKKGKVTAKKAGSATITVSIKKKKKNVAKLKYKVTVKKAAGSKTSTEPEIKYNTDNRLASGYPKVTAAPITDTFDAANNEHTNYSVSVTYRIADSVAVSKDAPLRVHFIANEYSDGYKSVYNEATSRAVLYGHTGTEDGYRFSTPSNTCYGEVEITDHEEHSAVVRIYDNAGSTKKYVYSAIEDSNGKLSPTAYRTAFTATPQVSGHLTSEKRASGKEQTNVTAILDAVKSSDNKYFKVFVKTDGADERYYYPLECTINGKTKVTSYDIESTGQDSRAGYFKNPSGDAINSISINGKTFSSFRTDPQISFDTLTLSSSSLDDEETLSLGLKLDKDFVIPDGTYGQTRQFNADNLVITVGGRQYRAKGTASLDRAYTGSGVEYKIDLTSQISGIDLTGTEDVSIQYDPVDVAKVKDSHLRKIMCNESGQPVEKSGVIPLTVNEKTGFFYPYASLSHSRDRIEMYYSGALDTASTVPAGAFTIQSYRKGSYSSTPADTGVSVKSATVRRVSRTQSVIDLTLDGALPVAHYSNNGQYYHDSAIQTRDNYFQMSFTQDITATIKDANGSQAGFLYNYRPIEITDEEARADADLSYRSDTIYKAGLSTDGNRLGIAAPVSMAVSGVKRSDLKVSLDGVDITGRLIKAKKGYSRKEVTTSVSSGYSYCSYYYDLTGFTGTKNKVTISSDKPLYTEFLTPADNLSATVVNEKEPFFGTTAYYSTDDDGQLIVELPDGCGANSVSVKDFVFRLSDGSQIRPATTSSANIRKGSSFGATSSVKDRLIADRYYLVLGNVDKIDGLNLSQLSSVDMKYAIERSGDPNISYTENDRITYDSGRKVKDMADFVTVTINH